MRLLLIALALAACTSHDEHHLELSWTIDKLGPDAIGVSVGCPEGWAIARLVAVDPAAPDVRHTDEFPCDAFAGTSSYLPADTYQAWIEITNADGTKVLAASPPETTWVTSYNPILQADLFVDAGYAEADFTIADPAACPTTANATKLSARLDVAVPGQSPFAVTFGSCREGFVRSPAIAPGTYTVTFGNDGRIVQTIENVVIEAPNRVTRLGPFAI